MSYASYTFNEVLNAVLQGECVCVFSYIISSLFLLSHSYAGFTTFVYGLVLAASIGLKFYSLRAKDRVLYGAMLGVVTLLVVMTLQQAIFWGQSSGCTKTGVRRALLGVECNQVGAMRSVCTFSVFMFLLECLFLVLVLRHKDDLLPVGSGASGGVAGEFVSAGPASYKPVPTQAASTDL